MEISKEIEKKLEEIATGSSIDLDTLKAEYEEFLKQDWLQTEDFVDDDDRHQYAMTFFHKEYVLRSPVEPRTIIPIGVDPVKTSQKGNIYSSIYALDGKAQVRRISLRGKEGANLTGQVNFFSKYKDVKLGQFGEDGDWSADDRADFSDPIQIAMKPKELVSKMKPEPARTNIKEAINNLSKRGSDGYTVKTDWKVVRGLIKSEWRKPDGDEYNESGSYRLSDMSISSDDNLVTDDGRVIPPGMTVWVSPKLMQFPVDSMVDCIGTVEERRDKNGKPTGEVSMNAAVVVGIHTPPVQESD